MRPLQGFTDGALTDQIFYGKTTGNFPTDVELVVDTTTDPMSTYPPFFPNAPDLPAVCTITLEDADGSDNPGVYYLEWWHDMLFDFAQNVKQELEGASWTTAPDDVLLLVSDDPARRNTYIKNKLRDKLVVVHSPEEIEPEEGFRGGFGRNGRQLSVQVSAYVKTRAQVSSGEEPGLSTLDTLMEDIRTELWPSGVPNELSSYIYYGELEPANPPGDPDDLGPGVLAASLRYVGYKMEY